MKYECKKMMSIIFLETLNIEWGQIDPKGNRRVKMVISRPGKNINYQSFGKVMEKSHVHLCRV